MKPVSFSILMLAGTLLLSCSSVSLLNQTSPSSAKSNVLLSSSSTCELPLFQATSSDSHVDNAVGFDVHFSRLQYIAEDTPIQLVREQINGDWRYVDHNKHVLPYEEIRVLYQTNVAIVRVQNRYGLVNGNYEEILPTEYDMIVQITNQSISGSKYPIPSLIYFLKDNHWYSADVSKGIALSFTPKTEKTADYNYKDFAVIINTQDPQEIQSFQYFGKTDNIAMEMLLPAFDGVTFQIYEPTGACIATKTAKLTYGTYVDTMFFDLYECETDRIAVFGDTSVLSLEPKRLVELSSQVKEVINYDADRMDLLEVYQLEDTQQYLISMVTFDQKQNQVYSVLLVNSNNGNDKLFEQVYTDTRFPATLSLMLVINGSNQLKVYYLLSDIRGGEYHTLYINN